MYPDPAACGSFPRKGSTLGPSSRRSIRIISPGVMRMAELSTYVLKLDCIGFVCLFPEFGHSQIKSVTDLQSAAWRTISRECASVLSGEIWQQSGRGIAVDVFKNL